jgi:hypothetical protein
MGIETKSFKNRLMETKSDTNLFVELLKNKHNVILENATKEQDLGGVDFFVDGTPIQFKVRYNRPDFPICLAQPFYGWDDDKTVLGRDFRCLCENKCKKHFLGVLENKEPTGLYSVSSEELKTLAKEVLKEWDQAENIGKNYARRWFIKDRMDFWLNKRNSLVFEYKQCQVWWKKNFNENFAKFNLYVPISILKSKDKLL